jgi:hypothetical protein
MHYLTMLLRRIRFTIKSLKPTTGHQLRWDESCIMLYVLDGFRSLRCVIVMH